ncbi:hypothetical protein ASPZODRAFT_28510 [Penicilliopsis zonata CBS 506.65]|uniref:Rieske domain-containing protein n=1 Tax=Penicilliopsis zonata CBS 506.65 TaxID=1073090 RepID=A0A1L9S7Q8_9EURO|nr:hypothetical protein ASPZODRAFT_28510 [Penicilliopsis zonata CBS 506.65]OJJ43193.1 hypothetical protein ASPZODRAFT_28510 [Penicilliopsis zonata CBS 506.65]
MKVFSFFLSFFIDLRSQEWLYICHVSHFQTTGDYYTLSIADLSFFIIRDKQGAIQAFHNVCRHRAYRITSKENGCAPVLRCRYHGWSYNTAGQLIKAPHFENVASFDRRENGLFPIHTKVLSNGMVFINLSASTQPPMEWEDSPVVNLAADSLWMGGCSIETRLDWKGIPDLCVRPSWWSTAKKVHFFFPSSSVYALDTSMWYTVSAWPQENGETRVRCDVYAKEKGKQKTAERVLTLLKERINATTQETQISDSIVELEHEVKIRLKMHRQLEETLGRQVHPTKQEQRGHERFAQAEKLCADLECLASKAAPGGVLAW